MTNGPISDGALDRMFRAVELVHDRLKRAIQALEEDKVPYALAGGNAVAAWMSQADEGGIRNTPNVDIIVRRTDFDRLVQSLQRAGFCRDVSSGAVLFLDGPTGSLRSAVHILFAGEKFRPEYSLPVPDVNASQRLSVGQVLHLEPLVVMKLDSHRLIDQVHIQDMIGVGLIDASWLSRVPPQLAGRLKELLDHPED